MRMPSLPASPNRPIPQQERAARRVRTLLDAAEAVFGESGFEAATMTAIAERSGTSIGGLYRYFPDKPAIAQALLHDYFRQAERFWAALPGEARDLPVAALAERMVEGMEAFVAGHPAYLPLNAAPVKFSKNPESRRNLHSLFAQVLMARQPALDGVRAQLITRVVLQLLRGLMDLYGEQPVAERPAISAEFQRALTLYLQEALGQTPASGPGPTIGQAQPIT